MLTLTIFCGSCDPSVGDHSQPCQSQSSVTRGCNLIKLNSWTIFDPELVALWVIWWLMREMKHKLRSGNIVLNIDNCKVKWWFFRILRMSEFHELLSYLVRGPGQNFLGTAQRRCKNVKWGTSNISVPPNSLELILKQTHTYVRGSAFWSLYVFICLTRLAVDRKSLGMRNLECSYNIIRIAFREFGLGVSS